MNPEGASPASHYLRFLAWAVGVTIVVAALGYVPTKRLAGIEGVQAMLAGCGVSLVASLAGAVPIALAGAGRGGEAGIAKAALASMLTRFIVVVLVGVSVALGGWFARSPLLIWIGLSYLALLVADTRYALRTSRSVEPTEE